MSQKYIEVTLIQCEGSANPTLQRILNSVNTYLLRNKGAVSDFNLIKDVVDRNSDTQDEEINTLLPIPLYLGLIGTMLGIIIGLFAMPSVNHVNFDQAIDILIGGVKIAMIASFIGLLLTIINSGLFYKGAKSNAENLKNDFFTFIQTELLPILSQNITSSIYSLQSNLMKFNDTFEVNIGNFNHLLDNILNSFNSQVQLMNDLKQVDVVEMSNININVLRELRTSTREFEKFNGYLQHVNLFVENAYKLNTQISVQIQKTVSLEQVAEAIGSSIQLNRQLIDILSSEMHEMDTRKKFMADSVVDVDTTIKKSLEELKEFTAARITAIRDFTIAEEAKLKDRIQETSGLLDELKKLSAVKSSMEKMEVAANLQNGKLDILNNSVISLVKTMQEQGRGKMEIPRYAQIFLFIFLGLGILIGTGYIGTIIYEWIIDLAD